MSFTYRDIFEEARGLSPPDLPKHFKANLRWFGLDRRVLAWSANYEHAVFDKDDDVHPATVCVWFQYRFQGLGYSAFTIIYKVRRFKTTLLTGEWRWNWILAEKSQGCIPFANNNPFDSKKGNAASNTVTSVFPQNQF